MAGHLRFPLVHVGYGSNLAYCFASYLLNKNKAYTLHVSTQPFQKKALFVTICISLLSMIVIILEKMTKAEMRFSTSLHIRVFGMIL